MKILIIVFTVLSTSFLTTKAQRAYYPLEAKVISIKELDECFIFTSIKKSDSDTIYLISLKDSLSPTCKYEKIKLDNYYCFKVRLRVESATIPDKNFRLRVKKTVVWSGSDDYKKYPSLIENAVGLFLKKDNLRKTFSCP